MVVTPDVVDTTIFVDVPVVAGCVAVVDAEVTMVVDTVVVVVVVVLVVVVGGAGVFCVVVVVEDTVVAKVHLQNFDSRCAIIKLRELHSTLQRSLTRTPLVLVVLCQ